MITATPNRNVDHTRWPCVSHPANMPCAEAVALLSRKGHRTLSPAPRQVPARDYVPPPR